MKAKLYSASEIAAMNLPGLPRTKAAVIVRARKEEWDFEEATGVGGTKRMYHVPDRYLVGTSYVQPGVAQVVGTIAAGTSKVDPERLRLAMRALREWEQERGLSVAEDRRSAIVAILYDYLENVSGEGKEAVAVVLRALG